MSTNWYFVENMDLTGKRQKVLGRVKWFSKSKGFGFVLSEDGGPDILLHANVLRNFGQSSIADGSSIELVVQDTDRGLQATEVLALAPPLLEAVGLAEVVEMDTESWETHSIEPARVKWFDEGKGFGFANVFGESTDVFIHADILRKSGLSSLTPGEAIGLRALDGQRGRLAYEVLPWDSCSTEHAD